MKNDMITSMHTQATEVTPSDAYIISEDGRVIAKGKLVYKPTMTDIEHTETNPQTYSIEMQITLTDEYIETVKSEAYIECERQLRITMREESKAGWGYIEKMRLCKGYPQRPYWNRTRSNPHRNNYH